MAPGARVVLLGWGNALPSQLVAYARLYKTLGLVSSSVIPSTTEGLTRPSAYRRAVEVLAAELASEGGERPLVVHVFSDNGFMGWAALLEALDASEPGRRARDAVRGVVLDSAPGLWAVRGPFDFARRFSLAMSPAVSRLVPLDARRTRVAMRVVTPLLAVAFLGYQVVFRQSVRMMVSAGDRVDALGPGCAQLFLFGEADDLVPPGDVRAWIARQRARGIDVEEQAFAGARHVALYPSDPRRYRAALRDFLARVL